MSRRPPRDQHFLVDSRVADRILDYAAITEDEAVLEIGGGEGILTERILARTRDLTVIELDRELAQHLQETFPDATLIQGDALDVDLPNFDVCVSNLPYSISSEITFRLLRHDFDRAILMYQKEFADRMVAEPGTSEYGRLTVAVHLYADVEMLETVPRTAFDPRPRVDSAVVRLTRRRPEYDVPDEEFFLNILRGVFTQRRKTLRNALRNTLHITGLDEQQVNRLETDMLHRRPGDLSPAEYADLCTELSRT